MPVVKFVLGLCGSGKSTLVRRLAEEGFAPFDEGVVPGLNNWEPFLAAVRDGRHAVVAEIAYYVQANRDGVLSALLAANADATVEWVCFENDENTANENCRNDPTRTPEGIAANIAQNRTTMAAFEQGICSIPLDATVVPILSAPSRAPDVTT